MSTVPFYAEQGTSPNDRATRWMWQHRADPFPDHGKHWWFDRGTARWCIPTAVLERLEGWDRSDKHSRGYCTKYMARDALREAAVKAIEEGDWTPEG